MIARAYTYIRWLSLDIVAGAIFVSLFLSSELGVVLSAIEIALLGLSVWLIYTTDHLLDVRKRTVVTARRMVEDIFDIRSIEVKYLQIYRDFGLNI